MGIIRSRADAPREHPAEALLAGQRARVDQAVAVVDAGLRNVHTLRPGDLVDLLLEVRHALRGRQAAE